MPYAIGFVFHDDVIIAAPKQKYFLPYEDKWKKAKNIKMQYALLSGARTPFKIQKIVFFNNQEVEFFDIQLKDTHTFCVSIHDVVVHNFPLCFIGFSIAWGAGVAFEGLYCGICIAGLWLGTKLLKNGSSNNSGNNKWNIEPTIGPGAPDPNDKNHWFKKLMQKAKEKALHQYKPWKFFKDPDTELWWTKDKGYHSGWHYKLYKERAKGLEWLYDANLNGQKIVEKHKSPGSKFIPYKELIFLA